MVSGMTDWRFRVLLTLKGTLIAVGSLWLPSVVFPNKKSGPAFSSTKPYGLTPSSFARAKSSSALRFSPCFL